MKRAYLTAKEVEEKLTALRTLRGYETVTEIKINEDKVEEAKAKRGNGDKTIISVNPILVHVPEWQRMLNVRRAEDIVKNDIFEGRREAPYNCINSWCEVEELE